LTRYQSNRSSASVSLSRLLAASVIGALAAYAPGIAHAARVGGILTGYESSTAQPSRDLHFQNEITGDVYLTPTHTDGGFSATLPPGIYSLRTESGAILKRNIRVESDPVSLGQVSELAPYAFARMFERQWIAPSILTSPAPSTAYVMTVDRTMPPPGAPVVPKPEINWERLPPGTQASTSGENVATGGPSNQPVQSRPVRSGTNAGIGTNGSVVGGSAGASGMGGMGGQPAANMPPATE
jgi:hypothetical protein